MSYDRRRLRGNHPAACTCVDCEKIRRGRSQPGTRTPSSGREFVFLGLAFMFVVFNVLFFGKAMGKKES